MNSGDVPTNAAVLPLQRAMPVTGPSGRVSPTDGRRWKPRLLNGRGEKSPSPDGILSCRRPAISTDAARGLLARAKAQFVAAARKAAATELFYVLINPFSTRFLPAMSVTRAQGRGAFCCSQVFSWPHRQCAVIRIPPPRSTLVFASAARFRTVVTARKG